MQHKAIGLILVITASLMLCLAATAQNLTKSPYSIIGIGEIQFQGTSMQSAMGQIGQGLRKVSDINMLNPASYSGLKYTVIEGGLIYSQGTLSQNSSKSDIDNSSFTYFMLGLPLSVKHKMGLVAALSPYSSVGYNVSTTSNYPYYPATTQMKGSGGLTRFNVGFGAQIIKGVSAGVNVSYIFGQLNTSQMLIIPAEYNKFNIAETRSRIVGGTQLQGGLQYYKDFEKGIKKEKYSITTGVSYALGASLTGKQEYFIRSMPVGATLLTKDTIAYSDAEKGSIKLPSSFSIGTVLEKKDKWMVGGDIHYTNWSEYRSFGTSGSLENSFGAGLGGSYTPDYMNYKNYFSRIEYRAGARFDQGNLVLADNNISSYALSLGAGLPLGKTRSKLNITGEYFVKGTTSDNLIKEEYFRIIIGISFSDRWFQRFKYD